MGAMETRLLRLREAARMMDVSYSTLSRWCREGTIRCLVLPSGQRRIMASEVDRILVAGYPAAEASTTAEE